MPGRIDRLSVYELSTDGSGKARKIFDLDNFANLFVNPSGSKIGYMPGDSTETHLVIRDTATGKLLRDAEIFTRTIEAEGAGRFGWMPDDKRIFFALSAGDSTMTRCCGPLQARQSGPTS